MKTFILVLSLYAQDGTIEQYPFNSSLDAASCAATVEELNEIEPLPAFAEFGCVVEYGA